jgi:3-hydroxyisobutyrate dehydrogenase-like beta-hydroxyacid dehydrogenase
MSMEGDHLKPSIGFIGMGHMGSHMAHRLLDAGYQLTVYDRTKERAKALGQRGAQVAQTPKDLAANCQVVSAPIHPANAARSRLVLLTQARCKERA